MLYFAAVIAVFLSFGDCQTLSDAKNVYTKLFTTDAYNKEIKPATDQNSAVAVSVSSDLVAINDFNEKAGILNVLVIFTLEWTDQNLVWTPSTYNGINSLNVAEAKLWKPILYNLKEAKQFIPISNDKFRIEFTYQGEVVWTPGGLIDIKCTPDVSKFPFDQQICNLDVTAWGFTSSDVTLKSTTTSMNTNYYEKNGVWKLESTTVESHNSSEVSIIRCQLKIKRLAAYYVVNIVMPMVILVLINPLVFLLPIDCGERIGFGLTLLLSFTVFTSVITSTLPVSSSPMSVLSFIVFGTLIISALISVLNVHQFVLFTKDESDPLPTWLLKIVDCLTCTCRGRQRIKDDVVVNVSNNNLQYDNEVSETKKRTWKMVVNVLDRLYLRMFYFIAIVFMTVTVVYISVAA